MILIKHRSVNCFALSLTKLLILDWWMVTQCYLMLLLPLNNTPAPKYDKKRAIGCYHGAAIDVYCCRDVYGYLDKFYSLQWIMEDYGISQSKISEVMLLSTGFPRKNALFQALPK